MNHEEFLAAVNLAQRGLEPTMNHVTVDYLENEVREMEATIEGLAQERTELEDALGRLIDAVVDARCSLGSLDLWAVTDSETERTIKEIGNRLLAAQMEAEGCGPTE